MQTNVLQLIGSFHQGGSERQAVQLVRLLQEEGSCQIFPACLNRQGVLLDELERIGFADPPEFPLTSFYDANMLGQLRKLAAYLRENSIEIIQTHDFYTNIFGMAAGALARVPVRIAAKRDTGTKSAAQQFFERRAFRLAHAVVVNAGAVRSYLAEKGVPPEKLYTIHNGLDLERLTARGGRTKPEILAALGLPAAAAHRPLVTIVANMRSEVKNHPMFLRAAARVAKEFPETGFILAGEGELTDRLKRLAAELDIEKNTFFPGRCRQVAELLAVSDVCVLSSRTEGFSNSILEYMAAARPVVATRVGGAAEAVVHGETGYLVAPDDDRAMADRLIELLGEPEKAVRMGRRGRRLVADRFSLSAQLEKTLSLYKNLLKR